MPSDTPPIRVLIVAAYASARAGLHALLGAAEEESELVVLSEVASADALARALPGSRPDVVLFQNEGESDIARVRDVLQGGEAGLVVLGGDTIAPLVGAPLAGWAVLRRDADAPEIVAAIRAVAAGLIVLDPLAAPDLLRAGRAPWAPAIRAAAGAPPGESLTTREREVLQLMAQGLPNKIIATRLGISLHTAKFHVASILAKLGASSRTEAVTLGARRGDVVF